jgi:hypothetical protein
MTTATEPQKSPRYTPEYKAWRAMRERCNNPRCAAYQNHGARGIKVCERWDDYTLFREDVGPRPDPTYWLSRVDPDRGYEPGNVVWAPPSGGAKPALHVTIDGRTASLKAWCKERGLVYATVWTRIATGMSPEAALSTPVRAYQHNEITIDGRTATLEEWCQEKAIPAKTARSRIKDGMTPEAAITTPVSPRRQERQITIDGETASLQEWCLRNGISRANAYYRIRQGLSPAAAVTMVTLPRVKSHITLNGKTATLEEWCAVYGVKPETARDRIRRGWTTEAAVSVPALDP